MGGRPGSGRVFLSNIEKIAREKDFYLPDMETTLASKLEGPASDLLTQLLAGNSLEREEKWLLAEYIALFAKRVPAYRNKIDSILAETSAEEMAKMQADIDKYVVDPELRARRLREVAELQDEWRDGPTEEVRHFVQQPWMTTPMVEAIFLMAWHFFEAAGPSSFATCDNPVHWFGSLGIGNEYSELSIPLSSRICLVATRADIGDQLWKKGPEKVVKELNRRAVSNATRFVFYPAKRGWLKEMVLKGAYSDQKRIYTVPKSFES